MAHRQTPAQRKLLLRCIQAGGWIYPGIRPSGTLKAIADSLVRQGYLAADYELTPAGRGYFEKPKGLPQGKDMV